jgi:hypothetical protein
MDHPPLQKLLARLEGMVRGLGRPAR